MVGAIERQLAEQRAGAPQRLRELRRGLALYGYDELVRTVVHRQVRGSAARPHHALDVLRLDAGHPEQLGRDDMPFGELGLVHLVQAA